MLYSVLEESFWLPSKPATSAPAWEADAFSKREHLLRKQMICSLRCA
jgi:hypothetical protein